jgi:TPR repeat protein
MPRSAAGYVYLLTNPSMPGQVKVGATERHPEDRRSELSAATGVPTPFDLVHWRAFGDCYAAEQALHVQWATQRVAARREFFRLALNEAKQGLDRLPDPTAGQTVDVRALLDQGFNLAHGRQGMLKNEVQALAAFEQAAAAGAVEGMVWAGVVADRLGQAQRTKPKQQAYAQRAIGHLERAMNKGHVQACARATWLYRRFGQHREADLCWQAFLDRLAAQATMDERSSGWLKNWAEGRLQREQPIPAHAVFVRHREQVKTWVGANPSLTRRLRRLGQPRWRTWVNGAALAALALGTLLGAAALAMPWLHAHLGS